MQPPLLHRRRNKARKLRMRRGQIRASKNLRCRPKFIEFAILIYAPKYLEIDPVISMPQMIADCRHVRPWYFWRVSFHFGRNMPGSFADNFQKSLKSGAKKAVRNHVRERFVVKDFLDLIDGIHNVAQPEKGAVCHQKT